MDAHTQVKTVQVQHNSSTSAMTQAFQQVEEKKSDELVSMFKEAHHLAAPFMIEFTKSEQAAYHFLNNSLPLAYQKAKITLIEILEAIIQTHPNVIFPYDVKSLKKDKTPIPAKELNDWIVYIDKFFPQYFTKTIDIINIIFLPTKNFLSKIDDNNTILSTISAEEKAVNLAKKLLENKMTPYKIKQNNIATDFIYQLAVIMQAYHSDKKPDKYKNIFMKQVDAFICNVFTEESEIQREIRLILFLEKSSDDYHLTTRNTKIDLLNLYQNFYRIYSFIFRHSIYKGAFSWLDDICKKIIKIDNKEKLDEKLLADFISFYQKHTSFSFEKIEFNTTGKLVLEYHTNEKKRHILFELCMKKLTEIDIYLEENHESNVDEVMQKIDVLEFNLKYLFELDIKNNPWHQAEINGIYTLLMKSPQLVETLPLNKRIEYASKINEQCSDKMLRNNKMT